MKAWRAAIWTARFSRLLMVFLLAASPLAAQTDTVPLKKQAKDLVFLEQPAAALEVLAEARKISTRDPEIPIYTGEAWFQLENYEKAVAAFREAVAMDPLTAPYLQNLGHALLKLERLTEAREQFQLIADKGANPAARARGQAGVGIVLAEQGDEKAARGRFEEALKLDPTLLRARYRLALIQIKADELAPAIENLRAIVESDRMFEGAAYNLALAYRSSKNEAAGAEWSEIFKQIRKAKRELEDLKGTLRKNPASAETVRAVARVYARNGSISDAISWLTRYLAMRPSDDAARRELEELRTRAKK